MFSEIDFLLIINWLQYHEVSNYHHNTSLLT